MRYGIGYNMAMEGIIISFPTLYVKVLHEGVQHTWTKTLSKYYGWQTSYNVLEECFYESANRYAEGQ